MHETSWKRKPQHSPKSHSHAFAQIFYLAVATQLAIGNQYYQFFRTDGLLPAGVSKLVTPKHRPLLMFHPFPSIFHRFSPLKCHSPWTMDQCHSPPIPKFLASPSPVADSVLPVPAGPAGAPPRFKCMAWYSWSLDIFMENVTPLFGKCSLVNYTWRNYTMNLWETEFSQPYVMGSSFKTKPQGVSICCSALHGLRCFCKQVAVVSVM